MTRALIECVPNFSEGRDKTKVDAIAGAMRLPGVFVLDLQMDADHNRSVITLAGQPDAIQEAAIRGVGKAAELIDLNSHRGVHPRMGATDVLPFIPIEGATLNDCVQIARKVGVEIWRRFNIPVYLYGAAATKPERENLANLRRGQFEGIREEIKSAESRKPDFGGQNVHPTAGITAAGARTFLIAFNVFLNTSDVSKAESIARAVRSSDGGLPYVKALGLMVGGRAQVSMNLADFEQTSIQRVFDAVEQQAAHLGVAPLSSELVGLIPAAALRETTAENLLLQNFDESMILENRIAQAMRHNALR